MTRLARQLLALALLAAACGGGLSRADYLSRANAICTGMNAKGSALPDPGQDAAKLTSVVDQTISITKDGLAQLRAIPAPSDGAAAIRTYYGKVDTVLGQLQQESAALHAGDLARAQSIASTLQTASTDATNAAKAAGLDVCAAA